MHAIGLRGECHRLAKDYPAAIAASHEARKLLRGLSPRSRDVAIGLNAVALALRAAGQYDEAERYCREALAIARDLPYPEGVAIYTGNLAELALDSEDWPAAERLAREALTLAEPIGRKELIAADDPNGVEHISLRRSPGLALLFGLALKGRDMTVGSPCHALSGLIPCIRGTQGVALGWYVPPLQG